jgi:inositol transport system substrate-binding protein
MKTMLAGALVALALTSPARAETIGVSMALFDDNFLTILRNGMEKRAEGLPGVKLQLEDGYDDMSKQIDQVRNFIAAGVDAIIVAPSNTDATPQITKLAAEAKIPLVYVNRQPIDLDELPPNAAFIASDEVDSGTLQMAQMCRLMNGQGNVAILQGTITTYAARQRTQDVHDVIAKAPCDGIKVAVSGVANFDQEQAYTLVGEWIRSGVKFDAVAANNDEMALGAIRALKEAKIDMARVVVGGIDATAEGLAAMKAGDLDVTVFQDAAGQGSGAVDLALKLARKEPVEQTTWVPFELVTPDKADSYVGRN